VIEQAGLKDARAILEVINCSNREAYRDVIPAEHFREPVLSMEELLEDLRRMPFYVYRSEGQVVGITALHRESAESGVIRWMYVLPGYQRRGIGTALLTFLEGRARELGLRRLQLLAIEGAHWATRFYKKHGYRPFDRIEQPWGADLLLEKDLAARGP